MKTPFEKSIFIHSAEKEHRDSIIANGLHGSKNPVVINGIFTFPEQWGHHKTSFDKNQFDQYKIKLKDGVKIFWTDSDRPLDALMGSGNEEYVKAYNEIIKNTSLKSKDDVMNVLMNFQGGNQEIWFKWKTEFSRGIEKYLAENNYAGIQQGGEIVITDLNSIESITLNGKKIKVNLDKKDNKMENYKFVDGGSLDRALDNSNAKPEEIISNEINFDTRKGLNRSDKVVPKEVIEEIEEKGMSLERLEELGLPIFKYQTQITVHGVFEGVGSGRIGGYKNLLSNQNQTLGIKYNAIDFEKKKTIAKALRLDREFNGTENGFNFRMDSKGFQLFKRRQAKDKDEYVKVVEELKSDSEKIPSNFIGKKMVNAYKIWGLVIVELLIDFKAIKQENLWSFISALTDGRINDESKFNELLGKQKAKEDERNAQFKKEREERESKEKELLNQLKDKATFEKSTSLPTSDEFIVAALGTSYGDAVIRVYSVFRNKTGRKVYSVKNVKDWSDVPATISDEVKNSRGNKFYDNDTIKILTKYIEKSMLFTIYDKVSQIKHAPIQKHESDSTVSAGDVLLLDDSRYQLIQSKHTKTGDTIYLFKLKQRVDRDDYKKIESNVKAIRGYYSSFVTAFVLKSAISANEAEMLLKGSSLENKNSSENGGEISDDKKINEAAKNEVEKLVNETGISKEDAVKEMKEGVKVEEEHRETLEKLDKGDITVEEAIAETASIHIDEKKDYYTEGLIPMENKDKSVDELKKQLSETELSLFNKAYERVPNIDLAKTIELADNIAKLENKERKDNLAFFAEALQYTTSDAENDVYARFWANDLLYMVGRTSLGFDNLERAVEVGAIDGGEQFLEHIKAFRMAARTFRELSNEAHKALIANFVEKFMLKNDELSTKQDYIWMAINDLYKLIYYAKGNESDTSKLSEYIGELITKYNSEIKLDEQQQSTIESKEQNIEEGYIEYTEGKYEDGTDVYGAIIRHGKDMIVIPLGRYETKEKVKERAEKVLHEFRVSATEGLGQTIQEESNLDAQKEYAEFEKVKNNYPIVLEMSEGTSERSVGFDYLHQLETFLKKKVGVSDRPTAIYLKSKVWFKDYPNEGDYSFFTIYSSYMKDDFNPESDELIDYLKKFDKNFNWNIYEYGNEYKFSSVYQPEAEFKDGDLVRVTIVDGEDNFLQYEYGYVKGEPKFVRNSAKWKPHYIYNVVDMFDDEKIFNDVIEWRLSKRTDEQVKEELTDEKVSKGLADLLTKEEATELSNLYTVSIELKHKEYVESGGKSGYLSERYESEMWEIFNQWFADVICRYPLMLSDWLNLQIEKLPKLSSKQQQQVSRLLNGFIDIDFTLPNLKQFINSLVKYNIGKTSPKGIYELIPEGFLFNGKLPKALDYKVDPSSDELMNIMKPFISDDDLRPVMASVNFDKKGATSTDAHRLLFIKGKTDKIGVYGLGKIAAESGQYTKRGNYLIGKKGMKYPSYEKVIPKEYSDVITLNRETVENIVKSLKTFKNVKYYNRYTDLCYVSIYKGEIAGYNINFLIELFEAWLKIGFDKLEVTNKTQSLYKGMPRRTILIVSPDIAKFTDGLKGSGSILMAIQISEDSPVRELDRGEMYLDINDGIAKTAGVTDDLFTDFNSAYGTFGAETEKEEINEMQMMIDLMEETVKENPTEENKDYLDLLKETMITLRAKNEEKFKCGGKMYYSGGKLIVPAPYKNGGNLFGDSELNNIEKINKINNMLFYRYYPVGVNPFEVSFEKTNKYGYGIYFLDNPYYYKNKFTNGRLLTIKPRLQNPLIFSEKSNMTPNGEYAQSLLAAMKNDNLADRDAFTRKIVEQGYDSLVAVEPRGTFLVLFSNDPELYEIDSDVSPDVIDEKLKNELNEKIDSAVNETINKYLDINHTEAMFLYNNFKQTVVDGKQKESAIWIPNDGFSGSMKKVLMKKNYIDNFWSVFNKPMAFDRHEYALTDKGLNFINDVQIIINGKIVSKNNVPENLTDEMVVEEAKKAKQEINDYLSRLYAERDFNVIAKKDLEVNAINHLIIAVQKKEKLIDAIISEYSKDDNKKVNGGELESAKEKLINILSSLNESDLQDFVYHFSKSDDSEQVDYIVSDYKNWVNGLDKVELDMILWKMKMPYFYEFRPTDNYTTPNPVPSKFAAYNDFYEKKYKNGGTVDDTFNYMMLSRLQSDVEYYLGHGNRSEKVLWAGDVDKQIAEMKRIWNGLIVKPEWLSMEQILEYERKMKSSYANGGGINSQIKQAKDEIKEAIENKESMALYKHWQNINNHTENLLLLAMAVGNEKDIEEAEWCISEQIRKGETTIFGEFYERSNALNNKLWDKFKAYALENENTKYVKGGEVDSLEKELHKLQRDLNSKRLSTYNEGDTSEEEMARRKEREVKLNRFNEVLQLLREKDGEKMAKGGYYRGLSDLKKMEIRQQDWNEMEVHFEPRGDNGLEEFVRNMSYSYKEFTSDEGRRRYLISPFAVDFNPDRLFYEVSPAVFNKYFKKVEKEEKDGEKEYAEGGEIDNPRALGTALKKYFKSTYGIDIDTRYIKTVRGLDNSWYEISTFNSKQIIPNEVRKELLELSNGKRISEIGVSNPDDISYGNVRSQSISAYGKHWKEWLKSKHGIGGFLLGAAVGVVGMSAFDKNKLETKKIKEDTGISIDVTKLPEKIRFYDDGKDISTRVWEKFDNGEWHKITRKQFDDYIMLGTDSEGLYNRKQKSENGKFVYYLNKKNK